MLSPLCKWKHRPPCLSWALHASPRRGSPQLKSTALPGVQEAGEARPTAPSAGGRWRAAGHPPALNKGRLGAYLALPTGRSSWKEALRSADCATRGRSDTRRCGAWVGLVLTEPHCKAGGTALPAPSPLPAPSSFSVLKTGKLRPKGVTACGWA